MSKKQLNSVSQMTGMGSKVMDFNVHLCLFVFNSQAY